MNFAKLLPVLNHAPQNIYMSCKKYHLLILSQFLAVDTANELDDTYLLVRTSTLRDHHNLLVVLPAYRQYIAGRFWLHQNPTVFQNVFQLAIKQRSYLANASYEHVYDNVWQSSATLTKSFSKHRGKSRFSSW